MEKLLIVGYENYPEQQVIVQRIDLENNKYLQPKSFKGEFQIQVRDAAIYIMNEKPDKLVFDESGLGMGISEAVKLHIRNFHGELI